MNNTNSNPIQICMNEGQSLDSLLDDALEDFNKPILPKRNKLSTDPIPSEEANISAWTDEFIKQATQNFEVTMKSILEQQKGENGEAKQNVDVNEMSAEFSKFAEIAAKAASEANTDKDFTQCLAETMQQISKNKEEAQAVPTGEELEKMFEQLGIGEMLGKEKTGEEEGIGGFFPLMQTMLENILSKEVLYHPMKEISTKYPDWLADNRSKLSDSDFDQYNKQYGVMKEVVEKFEGEKEDDPEEMKAQNFEEILKLMQKLQDYGQPPQELVGDQTPLINFDEHGNPQLPNLSTLFGATGFPTFGAVSDSIATEFIGNNDSFPENGASQQPNECSLM